MSRERWSHKIESHSPPIEIYERIDRGDQLYMKWSEGKSHRRPKLKNISTVRAPDGRIRQRNVRKAVAEALKQYEEEVGGRKLTTPPAEASDAGLTLGAGFDLVLDERRGKYASKTQRYKAMKRTKRRVLQVLGEEITFEMLRPIHYRLIWRTYAEKRKDWGLNLRSAEAAVSCLFSAENWLYQQGHIQAVHGPGIGWRVELCSEWEQLTGERPDPYRPRHDEDEAAKLWKHLPKADVRLQLAYELGAEYRLGQVIRADRLDLDLSSGAGLGHGTFRIRGRGRKLGQLVFLTAEQRAAVDNALGPDGFLSNFEAAYQVAELKNYPLFPGGKLREGKAVVRKNGSRMNRRSLLDHFHALEEIAGVEQVEGRGWYGVRRISSDLTADETQDDRVRDASGGWKPGSGTRERVYAQQERQKVLGEAAEARRRARGATPAEGKEVGNRTESDALEALEKLGIPREKLEAVLSLLTV